MVFAFFWIAVGAWAAPAVSTALALPPTFSAALITASCVCSFNFTAIKPSTALSVRQCCWQLFTINCLLLFKSIDVQSPKLGAASQLGHSEPQRPTVGTYSPSSLQLANGWSVMVAAVFTADRPGFWYRPGSSLELLLPLLAGFFSQSMDEKKEKER